MLLSSPGMHLRLLHRPPGTPGCESRTQRLSSVLHTGVPGLVLLKEEPLKEVTLESCLPRLLAGALDAAP